MARLKSLQDLNAIALLMYAKAVQVELTTQTQRLAMFLAVLDE